MSLTPNEKDLLAKKSDLEGILRPDADDVLHLPDITISLEESQGMATSYLSKDELVLTGGVITGISSIAGTSTSVAASQNLVATKQDQLTAGSNITITNNVISATDTTYSDMVGATTQADGAHGLVPAPTAGDENKFLKGDGTWSVVSAGSASLAGLTDVNLTSPTDGQALIYDATNQEWVNGAGGGGTNVIPNPQGTPTDTLNTVGINGVIYDIGGSGGGGDRTTTTLYTQTYLTSNPSTITLNDDVTNYDEIAFICTKRDDSNYYDYIPIQVISHDAIVDAMDGAMTGRPNVINISGWQPASQYLRISITDATTFTIVHNDSNFLLHEIIGINYSGGGSSGGGVQYGYVNPVTAAADGTVYYLLNSNNKLYGTWLYMNNNWVLIDGRPFTSEFILYDNGTEAVNWDVVDAVKNADNISLHVDAGTYWSYAITQSPIDITDYATINMNVRYRGQDYTTPIDISGYSGSKYISFVYRTDTAHNEVAIGITTAKEPATTIRIDSRDGSTYEGKMYYLSLE